MSITGLFNLPNDKLQARRTPFCDEAQRCPQTTFWRATPAALRRRLEVVLGGGLAERTTRAALQPLPHTDPARPRRRLCPAHPPHAATPRCPPTPTRVTGPAAHRTPSTRGPGDWLLVHARLRCFDPVNDVRRFSVLPPPNGQRNPPRGCVKITFERRQPASAWLRRWHARKRGRVDAMLGGFLILKQTPQLELPLRLVR